MMALSVAVLIIAAVLLWPARHRETQVAEQILRRASVAVPTEPGAENGDAASVSLWQIDPVEAFRARRARRRRGQAEVAALELLDAIAPALRAGLTPQRSFELAASVGIGVVDVGPVGAGSTGLRSWPPRSPHRSAPVGPAAGGSGSVAIGTSGSAEGVVGFWGAWAAESGSADLAFVASAWRLSESIGAPLAEAVDRAAAQLRSGLSRRRRLTAAIAGPRATVTLLTALPLSGPIFGLACGLSPSAMYLSSASATGSAVVGGLLIVLGRWWCTRIVRAAGAT